MTAYSDARPVNVGSGTEVTIAALAALIAEVVGYGGGWRFDAARPDGTPHKLADTSRLAALGWRPKTTLSDGLAATYAWYRAALPGVRA